MKKIILSLLSIIFMLSSGLYVYKCTQIQEVGALYANASDANIPVPTNQATAAQSRAAFTTDVDVNQQISDVSTVGTHVYFFYKPTDNNFIYIYDNVLNPLMLKENISHEEIKFIDMSALADTILPSTMKKNWGFDAFPAFVQANYHEDGTFEVLSVLQWSNETVLTEYDIKQWFLTVGLISEDKEDLGVPIEKPLE